MKQPQKLPLDYDHGTKDAQQITADVLQFLDTHGYEAWSQPNRGEYDPNTSRWRPHPNSRRGVPDILGFRRADGLFLGVEVKAGRDTLRPEQIIFLNQLKAAGGLPFVAHSFAGFVASFERRGLHRGTADVSKLTSTTLSSLLTTDDTPATYTSSPTS